MHIHRLAIATLLLPLFAVAQDVAPAVDQAMVAKIREEGLQHSRVMDFESYMTDVLGARLTLSKDMQRAQTWALAEMARIGLVHVASEAFMDYGVSWDNEYVSLHLIEPDYTPMVGYPIAYTSGTHGKQVAEAVLVELQGPADLEAFRGKLKDKAVLITPPLAISTATLTRAAPRLTDEDLEALEHAADAPPRKRPKGTARPRDPARPEPLSAEARLAFFKAEGVAVVLQCEGGWLGAVTGYGRPGAGRDGRSRAGMLGSPAVVVVTPEHYNRMCRILKRNIPVRIEVEVRNRIGDAPEQANNLFGEIAGSDLADEVVMIGAHFDTWHGSPNASDNTSGVAVALEAARILTAVGAKPRRTIRVALWAGEEQGLFGSRAYVRQHFGNPDDKTHGVQPAYDKLSVYFNQDYGAGQFRGIYLQGNEAARDLLTAWMTPFADLGMKTVSPRGVGSTDHVSFDEVGLPGFQFLQDRIPGTGGHTNMDFYDAIQATDLMRNATIMAAYAWHAAMTDARMPRKVAK